MAHRKRYLTTTQVYIWTYHPRNSKVTYFLNLPVDLSLGPRAALQMPDLACAFSVLCSVHIPTVLCAQFAPQVWLAELHSHISAMTSSNVNYLSAMSFRNVQHLSASC